MKAFAVILLPLCVWYLCTPCYSQRMEHWLQEETARQQRQQDGLQTMEERDGQGKIISREEYNKQGRVTYRLYRHKPGVSYGHGILPDDKATNIWHFTYDKHGNLLKAVNSHILVQGTTHGGGRPFSLPSTGPPYRIDTLQQQCEWTLAVDNKGRKIEEVGYYLNPVTFFHQTNGYANIRSGPKSRFVYSYDKKGRLVEEKETRLDIDMDPLFTYQYTYDKQGNLLNESRASGQKEMMSMFSYSYNKKNQLIEKHAYSKRITYSYDGAGNMIELKKFLERNGRLVHQQNFTYDEHGTVTGKKYSIQIENQSQHNATFVCEYDRKGRLVKKLYGKSPEVAGKSGFYYTY